jgi:VanZ family protein
MNRPHHRWAWAASVALAVYVAALVVGTHLPRQFAPDLRHGADRVLHALAYGGFALLAAAALSAWRPVRPAGYLALSIGLALFAVIDELSQIPVPGRTCDPWDVAADVTGAVIGLALFAALAAWRQRRNRNASPPGGES